MKDEASQLNADSLKSLIRVIERFPGDFSLILAHCNYPLVQQYILQQLHQRCPVEIGEVILEPSAQTLLHTIIKSIGKKEPPALMVLGLESVVALDCLLNATNQVREEFRDFKFPLVLWVTDEVLQKLIRLIPDFHSWSTSVQFTSSTPDLLKLIEQTTESVFKKILDTGVGSFIDMKRVQLNSGSRRRSQLESALQDLHERGIDLNSKLEASLEFVLGQDTRLSLEKRWQHYQKSWILWQQEWHNQADSVAANSQLIERIGCVWFYRGLWWRSFAVDNPAIYEEACNQSRQCFEELIAFFQQHQRRDLEAKFINAWAEVLQRLERWDELFEVAEHALSLHRSLYGDPIIPDRLGTGDGLRLAHDYLLLADVALAKSQWQEAKKLAQKAIAIQEYTQRLDLANATPENFLDWRHQYHREFYFLALGRALAALGEVELAIIRLEEAKSAGKAQYDVRLYIRILKELHGLYFDEGEYLRAAALKQEIQSLQQQYRLWAFGGGVPLEKLQKLRTPALADNFRAEETVATVRQDTLKQLQELIERHDCKLVLLYGVAGVGKTSLLQAQLMPILQNLTFEARPLVCVYLQVYTNWERELGQAIQSSGLHNCSLSSLETAAEILEQLRHNIRDNLLTLLIFDQLEDFFWQNQEVKGREKFSDFLSQCLALPYVKVILSGQDTCLPYLEDLNSRLDFPLLKYKIRLEPFSPEQAKFAIVDLAKNAQLSLESSLVDALVEDLAGDSEMILPLDLQILGQQLETEKIFTLNQYREAGGQTALWEHYLNSVIQDCGLENAATTRLILEQLKNEITQTKTQLKASLGIPTEQLDLILEILVRSGLVRLHKNSTESRDTLFYIPTFLQ